MFQSARIKLTLWYLLIIMSISVLFSIAIFHGATMEVERSLRQQQFRINSRQTDVFLVPPSAPVIPRIEPQLLEEAQERIKLVLIFLNLGIFAASGAAGFFLAGRTLKPIAEMVDEQNRFITDASHELRTPITSLKSEIEVYLREKKHDPKESERLLQSNLEEVNNLQILSDNLLQLAQYQKTNGQTIHVEISLKNVLEETVKKFTSTAKRKNITIVEKLKLA